MLRGPRTAALAGCTMGVQAGATIRSTGRAVDLGQDLLYLFLGERSTGVWQGGKHSGASLDSVWCEPSAGVADSKAEPLSASLMCLSDLHGLSDEEGSSEVFLATDSDYDSSRAQSPKELDLVYSSTGPECCSRRVARTLRDSAPDVLQTHELKTPPLPPPPPEEPRPPPELYDSDFVLPSRQIELLRITEKRQAYCVRTSSLDFPKPLCQAARKSCPGSVNSSPTESRTVGHCSQLRLGTGSTPSPEHGCGGQGSEPVFRTHSAEWTQSFQEQPDQPGSLADRGKKPGSVTLRVCPQYETGLSKETSVKVLEPAKGSAAALLCLDRKGWQDGEAGSGGSCAPRLALPFPSSTVPGLRSPGDLQCSCPASFHPCSSGEAPAVQDGARGSAGAIAAPKEGASRGQG